jgi:hypothetical protein
MKLFLLRDYRGEDCTLGKLHIAAPGQDFVCDTIERPWIAMPGAKGGLSGKSCVPEGLYELALHNSELHPNTWALVNHDLDVHHYEDRLHPEWRALALIHAANRARELRGCIASGLRRAVDADGVRMVTSSRLAMLEIKRLVPWTEGHSLEIS